MKYLIIFSLLFSAHIAIAQQKTTPSTSQNSTMPSFSAKYDGGDVILNYQPALAIRADSLIINVVRKGLDGEKTIRANRKIAANAVYKFADTSTRKMPGIYQYVITATIGSNTVATENAWALAYPADAKPSAILFKVENIKGTNHNVIKWKLQNNFTVNSLVLQRSRSMDGKFEKVATLNPKDSVHVDNVHDSNEPFYYRLDMTAHQSETVYQSITVFVIPEFVIVPKAVVDIKAVQKNNAVYVTWSNADEFARGYYVKKRVGNAGDFVATSSIITKNKTNNYLWKDTLSSLQPKEMYQYVVVAESNSFNQSNHSDTATISFQSIVKVLSPPTDLRILTANDTTYNLVWSVDSLHRDEVVGYQLYHKAKGASGFKAVKDGFIVGKQNYISIPKPKDGDSYYVKAVNGNIQSAASMTYTYANAFQKEFGPKYLKAAVVDGLLNIKWLKDEEVKFKAFKLYRWNGKSFALVEQINAEKDLVATKSYVAGELNIYKLTTINLQGEESNGSKILQVN